ncbi:MAG: amino acid permease [Armatimonadota bacterium]|jgi:APA family basic amino acid/polyamine antiporter
MSEQLADDAGEVTDQRGAAMPGEVIEVELAKGLGLMEALTIGAGTMIGAGIFVLPGLIFSQTGPAAVVAFLAGGLIALLVALSVAEIATGMPKSGGGYYFISRALGPLWGALVGWAAWFGLIFASSFYMVGFGEYMATVVNLPVSVMAAGMTVLLIGLNLVGSRAAGQTQNFIVVLLAILALFLGRGLFSAAPSMPFGDFAPFGWGAVAGGTATLFVTYAGFAGIASVAEEIRDPGRNVPRAVLGSVIGVGALYCVIILLMAMLRPAEELAGPTLLADISQDLMGGFGRWLIMIAAIMATVSSANASIMAASRISFAMGRDRLVPEWLNEIHERFRVPHRAIIVTGLLAIGFVFAGGLELLAEVSGFLHLVLYALISVACIILRGAHQLAYRPLFRLPGFPWVPLLGAAACVVVAFGFMGRLTVIVGLGVFALALLHYSVFGKRRTELEGAWPLFLRRGLLEPALDRVERWGAPPQEKPVTIVAVGNPVREKARLQIGAALMGPRRGRVLAVNVFRVADQGGVDEDLIAGYYDTVETRAAALGSVAGSIETAGAEIGSHVPVAASVFYGLLSAQRASRASTMLLGWPEGVGTENEGTPLLAALERHMRAHMMVFREQGPVPAREILAVIDESLHGEFGLIAAARLANAWRCELTVGELIGEEANEEMIAEAEERLDERVGDLVVKATVRTITTRSLREIESEAEFYDLVVTGIDSADGVGGLCDQIAELSAVESASMLIVRADEHQPLDEWM